MTSATLIGSLVTLVVLLLFEFVWLIYGATILSNAQACKEFAMPLWQSSMATVILGFIVLFVQCFGAGGQARN